MVTWVSPHCLLWVNKAPSKQGWFYKLSYKSKSQYNILYFHQHRNNDIFEFGEKVVLIKILISQNKLLNDYGEIQKKIVYD